MELYKVSFRRAGRRKESSNDLREIWADRLGTSRKGREKAVKAFSWNFGSSDCLSLFFFRLFLLPSYLLPTFQTQVLPGEDKGITEMKKAESHFVLLYLFEITSFIFFLN